MPDGEGYFFSYIQHPSSTEAEARSLKNDLDTKPT